MTLSRRTLLTGAATLAAGAAATATATTGTATLQSGSAPHHGRAGVKTLNGRSLEWRMADGVKEFMQARMVRMMTGVVMMFMMWAHVRLLSLDIS